MKNNILILGKGFIGQRIRQDTGWPILGQKIYSLADAEKHIKPLNPKVIVNCIGYAGINNIDECEIDKDKTLFTNIFLPVILSEFALRNNIKLVHISSGCIYHFDYNKDRPIPESKTPDFNGLFYSRSKIYAERALDVFAKEYGTLIIRIRVPLDNQPHPRNILTKLIKYQKVIDIPNSITYLPDFIEALKFLIAKNAFGIYNIVNKGGLKYQKLLDAYRRYVPNYNYEVIPYSSLKLVRTNLILSTNKLEKAGFRIRPITQVLDECVKTYLRYS